MRGFDIADITRRYWPLWVLGGVLLACVVIFADYLLGQQHDDAARADRTRQSLCAIIDRIPAGIDSGIDTARALDRCGKPHPPTLFFGRPFPTPRPAPTVTSTVIVVPGPTVTASTARTAPPRPAPAPSRTRTPPPRPSRTPEPSPSKSCLPVGPVCI